jgi:hypothetical protein
VLELRRDAELRQDRLADEVIEQARREFSKTPARAVELLERFSPPHPRVTGAARELRELISEQNEQVIRDAERRGEEERERQRDKEQRRREMPQAVERIRGYLDREELTEAAAALDAAEGTFGPASVFQELRARVKVAQRRLHHDDAARSAVGHGRNLAAAGDYGAALNLLEAFRPRHPNVDAAVEELRREQTETTGRFRAIGRTVSQPGSCGQPRPSSSSWRRRSGSGRASLLSGLSGLRRPSHQPSRTGQRWTHRKPLARPRARQFHRRCRRPSGPVAVPRTHPPLRPRLTPCPPRRRLLRQRQRAGPLP